MKVLSSALVVACAVASSIASVVIAPITSSPASAAESCGATILKPTGEAWRCTFADEFSGRVVNSKKWIPLTSQSSGLRGNGDCWVNTAETVRVASGTLRLSTRKLSSPITCTPRGAEPFETSYVSGSLSTYLKFMQAFGRWEIRAKFPSLRTPGSQTALWLYPYQLTYPWSAGSGEIDIAEFYTTYPDRVIPFIHYTTRTADPSVTNNYCLVQNPEEFHTYVLEWTRERVRILFDGRVCIDHLIDPALPLVAPQPLDIPFTTNLTQSLGVGTNSMDSNTQFPLTTQIDYVHVWA